MRGTAGAVHSAAARGRLALKQTIGSSGCSSEWAMLALGSIDQLLETIVKAVLVARAQLLEQYIEPQDRGRATERLVRWSMWSVMWYLRSEGAVLRGIFSALAKSTPCPCGCGKDYARVNRWGRWEGNHARG